MGGMTKTPCLNYDLLTYTRMYTHTCTLTCTHTHTNKHTHTDMDRRTEVPLVSWCNILRLLLNVLQCCPHSVLAGASHNNSTGADWSEVSELWFLAMQGE